jgi:hypothetical protein
MIEGYFLGAYNLGYEVLRSFKSREGEWVSSFKSRAPKLYGFFTHENKSDFQ